MRRRDRWDGSADGGVWSDPEGAAAVLRGASAGGSSFLAAAAHWVHVRWDALLVMLCAWMRRGCRALKLYYHANISHSPQLGEPTRLEIGARMEEDTVSKRGLSMIYNPALIAEPKVQRIESSSRGGSVCADGLAGGAGQLCDGQGVSALSRAVAAGRAMDVCGTSYGFRETGSEYGYFPRMKTAAGAQRSFCCARGRLSCSGASCSARDGA